MLFSQKEFEHKIEEFKLKKGLKLFLKNKVELISKAENGVYLFLIREKKIGEIFVQIKSEKIISYKCFCNDKNYCEHLAGALFYLQKETFGLEQVKNLRKIPVKLNKKKKNSFSKYVNHIKAIINPFATFSTLTSAQVTEVYKKINFEKSGAANFNHDFYFNLAIICELSKLPNYKYSEAKNAITAFISNALQETEIYYNKGLTAIEEEAFIEATYYSLQSQQNFRAGMYPFFISRASVILNNKSDFEALKILIKKRRQNKNKSESVNRKLVAELQLSKCEAEFVNKTYSLKNYESSIELPIAQAEIEFNKKNAMKAFKVLERYAEKIKPININIYLDFISEVLIYAKKYGNSKLEQNYLLEKFVNGYFIDATELDRYFELNRNRSKDALALELFVKIKSESLFFTFEKVATLLLSQNKLDELVSEIKKEKNKFKLLNEIGIRKLPQYSPEFITLYVKHFVHAIADAKFPYFQQQLFDIAKTYLDELPSEIKEKTIETIKEKMIYEKHMVAYITKLYALNV